MFFSKFFFFLNNLKEAVITHRQTLILFARQKDYATHTRVGFISGVMGKTENCRKFSEIKKMEMSLDQSTLLFL